jgi:MFS family permease
MSWYSPPPLVQKPIAPGSSLPKDARKDRVLIFVLAATIFSGLLAAIGGFIISYWIVGWFHWPAFFWKLVTVFCAIVGMIYGSWIGRLLIYEAAKTDINHP